MTQFHSNDFRFDNDGTDDGEDEEGDNGDGESGGGRGDRMTRTHGRHIHIPKHIICIIYLCLFVLQKPCHSTLHH